MSGEEKGGEERFRHLGCHFVLRCCWVGAPRPFANTRILHILFGFESLYLPELGNKFQSLFARRRRCGAGSHPA